MTYQNKTQPTSVTPKQFLDVHLGDNEEKRADAEALIRLYSKVTGSKCVMWNKIFGFGKYQYLDSKGGEHVHLLTGFAISSTGFTLYLMTGWETVKKELPQLGKYKLSGKSCLAIKRVGDVDLDVLERIIIRSLEEMKKKYKTER